MNDHSLITICHEEGNLMHAREKKSDYYADSNMIDLWPQYFFDSLLRLATDTNLTLLLCVPNQIEFKSFIFYRSKVISYI